MPELACPAAQVSAPEKDELRESTTRLASATSCVADMEKLVLENVLDIDLNHAPAQGADCPCSTRRMDNKGDWFPGKLFPVLPGRLSFAAHRDDQQTIQEIKNNPSLFFTSSDLQERYFPFCADFGPVNLGIVVQFCHYLRNLVQDPRLKKRHVVYYCENESDIVTNTVFLMASFLVLDQGLTPEQAVANFEGIPADLVVAFRDASNLPSTFHLTVLDCLKGLEKAVECGWFNVDSFDIDEYLKLDDPSTSDMHRCCPKFFACRAPTEEAANEDEFAIAPASQLGLLQRLDVNKLIHLNSGSVTDHHHMKEVLERGGVQHRDLYFDSAVPSDALVANFLSECTSNDDHVIAVSCKTGLGRTGTMIAVYIMTHFGFSAREAIGWLRIVRPGVILGPQQHYLEDLEHRLADGSFHCA